jgi:hypothetical protein
MKRMYLAIHALFADAARDQLGVLRAKIEDENEFVVQGIGSGVGLKSRLYVGTGRAQRPSGKDLTTVGEVFTL